MCNKITYIQLECLCEFVGAGGIDNATYKLVCVQSKQFDKINMKLRFGLLLNQ